MRLSVNGWFIIIHFLLEKGTIERHEEVIFHVCIRLSIGIRSTWPSEKEVAIGYEVVFKEMFSLFYYYYFFIVNISVRNLCVRFYSFACRSNVTCEFMEAKWHIVAFLEIYGEIVRRVALHTIFRVDIYFVVAFTFFFVPLSATVVKQFVSLVVETWSGNKKEYCYF